jgi:CRP-like cAMP-binding protein
MWRGRQPATDAEQHDEGNEAKRVVHKQLLWMAGVNRWCLLTTRARCDLGYVRAPVNDIRRFIASLCEPPPEQLEALLLSGRVIELPAGAFFCAPGQVEHQLGFLHEGLARYHVLTEAGDDITKDFALPGRFTVSFGSAVQYRPAHVAVSTVTPCRLTVWPWTETRRFFEGHLEWQRMSRRIAEWLYVRKEQRELDLLSKSASERYMAARAELGESFGLLPRHLLASYLGIAPESLSRLRKKLLRER